MWLINAETLQREFFSDSTVVDYVILSHTWGREEVTFQDLSDLPIARHKAGWHKIEMTCRLALAAQPSVQYVWVDTCCIDKTSSSELSEAINSMFAWYRDASFCIVYLVDYDFPPVESDDIQTRLARCRWFSRGWTLQELIAPREIRFYHSLWGGFGTKEGMLPVLSRITGIDSKVLENPACLAAVPVGRRLSWAALRSTSRIEDMAYSLLGIFDINMPLLYGEGQKAFVRLQEEIARSTSDLSLFAWQQTVADDFRFRGIFAHSPREFLRCRHLKSPLERLQLQTHFALTNRGLQIEKNLMPTELRELDRTNNGLILGLDCVESSPETNFAPKWIGIYLWRHGSTYVRWSPRELYRADSRREWMSSPASPAYITTVLSQEEIKTMHVQTKILIISNRSSAAPSGVVERIVNTRGSFISFHIFPVQTGGGLKANEASTTNIAVIYGIQGDPGKRPEDREPWAMIYRQGQAPKAVSNHIDDIFLSGQNRREIENVAIAQDFVFSNYSDEEGSLRDDQMPKRVDIPDSASKIHRVSIAVEAEPTVLQFGQSTYNRTFMIIVSHSLISHEISSMEGFGQRVYHDAH